MIIIKFCYFLSVHVMVIPEFTAEVAKKGQKMGEKVEVIN